MPIDVAAALGAPPRIREVAWTSRDVLLYHLSLGAGRDADRNPELRWTFERDLQVLPTFAMVAGQGPSTGDLPAPAMALPGIDVDLRQVLHGGQALTLHSPIPANGRAELSSRIVQVWDKGKAAVVVQETSARSPHGAALWTNQMQIWIRGEGGFGGEPGPASVPDEFPARDPDQVLEYRTSPQQALLYRLNGDLNPLHADPAFAKAAGFPAPILHGLASYGIVAKSLVDGLLGGDPSRLASLSVRFAGVVLPGQTLRTRLWVDGDQVTLRVTCPENGDAPVLSQAHAEIRSGISGISEISGISGISGITEIRSRP